MVERYIHLLVRHRPRRTIALRPPSNISSTSLIIESVASKNNRYCTARFQPSDTIDWTGFQPLSRKPICGCLGLLQLDGDVFVCVVLESDVVGSLESSAQIHRILKVAFFSGFTKRYDDYDSINEERSSSLEAHPEGIPFMPLIKLLSTGSFYYSPHLDITRSTQTRGIDLKMGYPSNSLFDRTDNHFVWNKHLLKPLLKIRETEMDDCEISELDKSGILIVAIQGFVGFAEQMIGSRRCKIAIVSRLSSKRAGTRFNARGLNDEGHVSNFVETEFLYMCSSQVFSFLQVRGSVPLFWEQSGIQMTSHKIEISRGPETTEPAMRKHMEDIIDRYSTVHIVNLLKQNDNSATECILGETYKYHVAKLSDLRESIRYTEFDFHAIVKRENYDRLELLIRNLRSAFEEYGYFLMGGDEVVLKQMGVFRTNCLDCLDRTNVVQTEITRYAIVSFLNQQGERLDDGVETVFNNLWADNGDWLSRIYTGTGALKSSYTRKGKITISGFLDDAAKSVNRFYMNNFQDKSRQEAIDLLVGRNSAGGELLLKNPLHDQVQSKLKTREAEFCSRHTVNLFVGSFNVNGKIPSSESLDNWLKTSAFESPDMYIIGIQELIQLVAEQIVRADTEKLRNIWESILLKGINNIRSRNSGVNYVVLRTSHLVALGLFVFVRTDKIAMVRDVEISIKKTGLGGMAGNKGGIGCSMFLHDTPVVFITAHLAAGSSNVADRNRDYHTITDGLNFRGRKIQDHQSIFWFGDFNYRVNLPNETVRGLVKNNQIPALLRSDQLKEQQSMGLIFHSFIEGDIKFHPTYKYDNGTNNFDSSEKMRTPSWTDRVMYRGENIELLEYSRGELLISDHKPVRAAFVAQVTKVDQSAKKAMQKEIYQAVLLASSCGDLSSIADYNSSLADSTTTRSLSAVYKSSSTSENQRGIMVGNLIDISEDFSVGPPPPLPSRNSVASNAISDPFATAINFDQALPPPSSETEKWWDRRIDETWIPRLGDERNPFYTF